MKIRILIAVALLAFLAPIAGARHIAYLGTDSEGRAVLQTEDGNVAVRQGDEVPGWGTVVTVDPDQVVIERTVSTEEKERLKSEGMLGADVERAEIPRQIGIELRSGAPLLSD